MNQPAWTDDDDSERTSSQNDYKLSDRLINISMSENGVASCEENYSSDPGEEVDVPIVVHLEQRQSENDDSSELDGDKATGGRYFAGGTGGSQRCFNCGLPGHLSRDCPENLPCFLCGERDHQRKDCPEEICYNCGHVGHMSKACSKPRKRRMFGNDFCNRCGLPGHLRRDCSLSWRRYVFVREPSAFEVERATTLLCPQCYNCAAPSHYGDECPNRRRTVEWSIFHTPNWEFLQQAVYLSQERQTRKSPKRKHETGQHSHPHRKNYIRGERAEERDRDREGERERERARDRNRNRHRERERARDRDQDRDRNQSHGRSRGEGSSSLLSHDHDRRHHDASSNAHHRPPRECTITDRRESTVYRRPSLTEERDLPQGPRHHPSKDQQTESQKESVPGRDHLHKQAPKSAPKQRQIERRISSPIGSRHRKD